MVDRPDGHIRYHMQLNRSFLAIDYDITDICDSRVTFATEKIPMKALKQLEKFHKCIKNSGDFLSLSGQVGYPPLL